MMGIEFCHGSRNKFAEGGEMSLLAHMLMIAIQDATRPIPRGRRDGNQVKAAIDAIHHRQEARQWFAEASNEPFGARWVCSILDADWDMLERMIQHESASIYRCVHNMRLALSSPSSKTDSPKVLIDLIVDRAAEGMSDTDIAREVECSRGYVYQVRRKYAADINTRRDEIAEEA